MLDYKPRIVELPDGKFVVTYVGHEWGTDNPVESNLEPVPLKNDSADSLLSIVAGVHQATHKAVLSAQLFNTQTQEPEVVEVEPAATDSDQHEWYHSSDSDSQEG